MFCISMFLLAFLASWATPAVSEIVPLYRYYKAPDHLYTASATEIGTVTTGVTGKNGYKFEGIPGFLSNTHTNGTAPLYRYYKDPDHFYTTNAEEIGTITPGTVGKHGYQSEGVTGYCWPEEVPGTIPLYRYRKNLDHFYTTDAQEIGTTTRGTLGKQGYWSEGVACYVHSSEDWCEVKHVGGRWVKHNTIATPMEETYRWGSSKTHETSRTAEWSSSMTVTVSAGFEFLGMSSAVEVSGTIAKSIANQETESWTRNEEHEITWQWQEKDVGRTIWQFVFHATDSCNQEERIRTKEFAVTEGAFQEPCCLPGWAADAPLYSTCYSTEAKVSENPACKVREEGLLYP